MLPQSSELRYFLEVAATLNISRAAERLGVTQPTLSLAVQKLEQSLGVALLIRNKSGVRLTKQGERFQIQARALIELWEKIRSEALNEKDEARGRFTIGCHPSVALYSVPGFLPAIIRDYPQIELTLMHDLSRKITESVISYRIDFGLVINPVEHPDLVIHSLTKDEVTLWRGPKEQNLDVLICDPELTQTQEIGQRLAKRGFEFKRVISSSSLEVIAALVASGAGVGILPTRVARRDAHLKLQILNKSAPIYMDRLALIFRADAQKGRGARVVIDGVRSFFEKNS